MAVKFLADHQDTQGHQKTMGSKGIGSKIGCCPWCHVEGVGDVYNCNTHYFPSAVRYLPMDDPLRTEWQNVFARREDLQVLGTLPAPDLRTTAEAVESGRKVENKPSLQPTEPYRFVSVWCEELHDFDLTKFTVADPAHQVQHCTTEILEFLFCADNSQMTFSEARKTFEQDVLGRFTAPEELKKLRCSPARRKLLNMLMNHVKICKGWESIRKIVSNPGQLKLVQAMQVGGDVGKYVIGLTDIDPDLKVHLIELLDCLDVFVAKITPKEKRADLQIRFVRVLTVLELRFPLYWCTATRHILVRVNELHTQICIHLQIYLQINTNKYK